MKHSLRMFTSGLLSATLIFALYYYFIYEVTPEVLTVNETLTNADMIQALESEGYYISDEPFDIDTDDNNDTETPTDEEDEDPLEDLDENESSEEIPENIIDEQPANNTFILTIEPGMSVSQVADYLILANIVDSRDEFANYLLENGYGTNIQVGSFELERDMSLEEVAETIARRN